MGRLVEREEPTGRLVSPDPSQASREISLQDILTIFTFLAVLVGGVGLLAFCFT